MRGAYGQVTMFEVSKYLLFFFLSFSFSFFLFFCFAYVLYCTDVCNVM